MGRAFEFRKVRKFKRWDKMSKAFTKIGREIAIACYAIASFLDIHPRAWKCVIHLIAERAVLIKILR